jgi:peptidoglycan/LPS O-acetylase OafA/YrhL
LFYFNLNSGWDVWAPYFFGSYGLGMLAWWAAIARKRIDAALLTGAILLLGGLALEMEFRGRIALALATSLLLILVYRGGVRLPVRRWPALQFFGRISYALFLVHFPICLLVNAAFTRFMPATPEAQATGMLLAWTASIVAAAAFHEWVEVPLGRLLRFGQGGVEPTKAPPFAT